MLSVCEWVFTYLVKQDWFANLKKEKVIRYIYHINIEKSEIIIIIISSKKNKKNLLNSMPEKYFFII